MEINWLNSNLLNSFIDYWFNITWVYSMRIKYQKRPPSCRHNTHNKTSSKLLHWNKTTWAFHSKSVERGWISCYMMFHVSIELTTLARIIKALIDTKEILLVLLMLESNPMTKISVLYYYINFGKLDLKRKENRKPLIKTKLYGNWSNWQLIRWIR